MLKFVSEVRESKIPGSRPLVEFSSCLKFMLMSLRTASEVKFAKSAELRNRIWSPLITISFKLVRFRNNLSGKLVTDLSRR